MTGVQKKRQRWGKPRWIKPERKPATREVSLDEYYLSAQRQAEVDTWIKSQKRIW